MPQAVLPDLNTAYIRYRTEILINLKSKNYLLCFGALNAINGLLPKNYQVKISDLEYKKATETSLKAACNFCTMTVKDSDGKDQEIQTEHEYNSLKFYNRLLPLISRTMTNQTYEKVWDCPKCNKTNQLEKTELIQNTLQEPYFLQVVPKPPIRKEGIASRYLGKDVEHWILDFLGELEHQMGKYRSEYVPKGGELPDDEFQVEANLEDYL